MNAKEFLQSYRNSLLASQVIKDEIEVIEAKMGASSPKLDKVGTSQISSKSKLDIYGNRYHDLLEQLIGFQRIEADRLTDVLKVINKINDGEIKTILYKRYIKMMKWERIARDMNYDIRVIYRKHNIGLDLVQEVIKSQ